jgi:hypothetical protein
MLSLTKQLMFSNIKYWQPLQSNFRFIPEKRNT